MKHINDLCTIQLIRELLEKIRFYTSNIPEEMLPNGEWDKIRKNFCDIDFILSKTEGYLANHKEDENEKDTSQ